MHFFLIWPSSHSEGKHKFDIDEATKLASSRRPEATIASAAARRAFTVSDGALWFLTRVTKKFTPSMASDNLFPSLILIKDAESSLVLSPTIGRPFLSNLANHFMHIP